MGSPSFYLYPVDGGPLVTLSMPGTLSDLEDPCTAVAQTPVTATGVPAMVLERTVQRVRISRERWGDTATKNAFERACRLLQNHLDRGGLVGFSRDHAKTWAGVCGSYLAQGATSLPTSGNGFSAWSSLAALANGDELVVEEGAPGWRQEVVTYASGTTTLTVAGLGPSSGLAYAYDDAPIVVRARDFWPVLWRPSDERQEPIIRHDRRLSYTLDVVLEYSPSLTIQLFYAGGYTLGGTVRPRVPLAKESLLSGALPLGSATAPYGSAHGLDGVLGAVLNRPRVWGA